MHGYDLSDDNDFEPLKTFVTGYDAAPSNDAVHECLISARKSTKDKFAAMWEDATRCVELYQPFCTVGRIIYSQRGQS